MTDFAICPPLLAATDEDKHTSVVDCAIADLAIPGVGSPVPINPVTGKHECPYQPTTVWTCTNG
jgi:hypothetical protein